MTPPAFLAACLERARETGRPVVGVRPVTDTVKVVADGRPVGRGETLDRDGLLAVASPLVIPAAVAGIAGAMAVAPTSPGLVADLAAAGHAVETLEAPPEGRRVSSPDDVRLLDALTARSG